MFLTRFGYHALVVAWLGVMAFIDVIANTMLSGLESDIYFYKVFLDGALIWWTILFLKEDLSGSIVSSSSSRAGRAGIIDPDRGHEAVIKVDLGAAEYIYYGFLAMYSLGNLYFHHAINKNSTGVVSMATLVLSMVDVVIAAVALINFYQVASGKLVKLQQRVSQ